MKPHRKSLDNKYFGGEWLRALADIETGWDEREPHQLPRIISADFARGCVDEPRETEEA